MANACIYIEGMGVGKNLLLNYSFSPKYCPEVLTKLITYAMIS